MVLLSWLPAILLMAVIFILSSIPDLGPLPGGVSDKSWHALGYAVLGILNLLALARWRVSGLTWGRVARAVLLATLFGASDEFHQSFVPGRTAEGADILADAIGAACGAGLTGALRAWGILNSLSRRPGPS